MPLFQFYVEDGTRQRDPEKIDLPNVDAARQRAATRVNAMLSQMPSDRDEADGWQMRVTDEAGRHCFSFQFLPVRAAATAAFDYRLPAPRQCRKVTLPEL